MSKNWQNCKDLIYRIIRHNSPYLPPIRGGTAAGRGPQPGSCPTAGGRKDPVIVYDVMTAPPMWINKFIMWINKKLLTLAGVKKVINILSTPHINIYLIYLLLGQGH